MKNFSLTNPCVYINQLGTLNIEDKSAQKIIVKDDKIQELLHILIEAGILEILLKVGNKNSRHV